jgi:D-3-phosphoglycerate dehydrogenase
MRIVITDHRFPNVQQESAAAHFTGAELLVPQTTDEDRLVAECREADAVMTVRAPISKRVIDAMQRCRLIVRYGIGVDNVDVAAATARGIMVANVPDYCVDEVSDHALTLLLMLSRQTLAAMSLAREETWATSKMPQLHRLKGQVCGLFGAGKIGALLASKVQALGMQVIVSDPYLDTDRANALGARKVSWDTLIATSDFISAHAPLTEDTREVFNDKTFAAMKRSAFIINTARGGLIKESHLIRAIENGEIAGAGLDVVESETAVTPLRLALVNHPKVIVTAHTAWLSDEARASLQERAISQVLACFRGERPYGLVNGVVFNALGSDRISAEK